MNNRINSESVAYWFFRLNGCLTVNNFMVHQSNAPSPHTEADIVAVRFPYRVELDDAPQGPMQDHQLFDPLLQNPCIQFYLTEVKFRNAPPRLNPSWLDDEVVIQELLRRFGLFPQESIREVVQTLTQNWVYEDERYIVKVVIVANRRLQTRSPRMPLPVDQQLTWNDDILPFIYGRLKSYEYQKRVHSQWDETGQELFKAMRSCDTKEIFVAEMLRRME